MQNDLFKYILNRSKRTVLLPFYNYMYKFKKIANLKVLLSKLFAKFSASFRNLFSMRPKDATDYYYIGRLGIYKKLLVLLLLLICLSPVIYFEFFAPKVDTVDVAEGSKYEEFMYNSEELEEYSGKGKILNKDKKVIYIGDISKGVCAGNGKLYENTGYLVYDGEFNNNMYAGTGTLFFPSGKVKYSGEFAANLYEGQGILYNSDGSKLYEGAFIGGVYSGEGVLNSASGKLLYSGTFKDGLYEGFGTLYNASGKAQYTGDFVEGIYSGNGTLWDDTGKLMYEGGFLSGKYSGQGIQYSLDTGNVLYNGTFKEGIYYGEGTLFNAYTQRIEYQGNFQDGMKNGVGTQFAPTGRAVFTGNFLCGKIDYVYFLDLQSKKLTEHYSGQPSSSFIDNTTALSYKDTNATFIIDESDPEAEPIISSVIVYDGTLPYSLSGITSKSEFDNELGMPIYEGTTVILPKDMIALKSLKDSSLIDESSSLYAFVEVNYDFYIDSLYDIDWSFSDEELYVACYMYKGFPLTIFFSNPDKNFLYYSWDNK